MRGPGVRLPRRGAGQAARAVYGTRGGDDKAIAVGFITVDAGARIRVMVYICTSYVCMISGFDWGSIF